MYATDRVQTPLSQSQTVLEARLEYASRGWETFPANLSGKVKKSHKKAEFSDGVAWGKTLDPDVVRADCKQWPNAGVGIATGAGSGIWVLETDTAKGHGVDGIASLEDLERKHSKLPETLRAISPSGSVHYYWSWVDGIVNSSSKVAAGVDVRGAGGMVIGVPTVRADGQYRWLNDAPIADAPRWLIDLAKGKTSDNVVKFPSEALLKRMAEHAGKGVSTNSEDILPKPAVDMAELRAALFAVNPNVYDNWFACMAALKTDLGEDGRALALEWTEAGEGPDWQTRRLDRFDEKWTKDLGSNTAAGKKHIGLIFHLAKPPTIYCKAGEIPRMTNEAEAALIKAGAEIYAHGGQLVQPVIEECDAAHDRKTTVARFRPMTNVTAVEAMSETATWMKKNRNGDWIRTDPPVRIANTLLEREGRWKLPRVVGIITCPTLRPDGSLLSVPGYDPETKLLLVSPPPMPTIPEAPTKDDAKAALALLDVLLDEFPFVDDVSRSVGLSALLTSVARGAMMCAPAHVVTAPEAGTGKSYMIDLGSAIATGRWCPVIAAGRNEEETEKRLGAILIKGQPLVSIDNVNGSIGGDLLCQMITQPTVDVRVLGLSKTVSVANHSVLFINGNNVKVVGDMVRRVVRCSMDANLERPETRKFKGNPVDMVLADRGQYIAAALTVVRAYIAAGRPGSKDLEPFLGFDGWNATVRGALVWLGKDDPTKSVEGAREEDPGRTTLARVVAAIAELKLDHAVTAGELVKLAGDVWDMPPEERRELCDALSEVAGDHHGRLGAVNLGRWLGQHKGRVVGGFKIVKDFDKRLKQATWKIEKWPK